MQVSKVKIRGFILFGLLEKLTDQRQNTRLCLVLSAGKTQLAKVKNTRLYLIWSAGKANLIGQSKKKKNIKYIKNTALSCFVCSIGANSQNKNTRLCLVSSSRKAQLAKVKIHGLVLLSLCSKAQLSKVKIYGFVLFRPLENLRWPR